MYVDGWMFHNSIILSEERMVHTLLWRDVLEEDHWSELEPKKMYF